MGAALTAGFNVKIDPPTVLWVHSKDGVQFGLDLNRLSQDLRYAGVQLLVFTETGQAIRAAASLGPSLRCVVENWCRKMPDSGRRLIESLQDRCGRARRHVPVLVLAHSVLKSQVLQAQVAELGETSAIYNPRTLDGYVRLVEWIVLRCIGIDKTVLFVRHGEAEHNVSGDWSIRDPALTETGKFQAQELAKARLAEGMRAEVVISSPLRRTLETTWWAFSGSRLPVVCQSLLQEGGDAECDTGSDKAALQQWFPGNHFSFEPLDDLWYVKEGINAAKRLSERLSRFVGWMRQRRESSVVVVAHGIVLRELLGLECDQTPSWGLNGSFDNCEYRHYWLLSSGAWLAVPCPKALGDDFFTA